MGQDRAGGGGGDKGDWMRVEGKQGLYRAGGVQRGKLDEAGGLGRAGGPGGDQEWAGGGSWGTGQGDPHIRA